MNRKRITALVLVIVMTFGLWLSYAYIVKNVHHEHRTDCECPVCMEIRKAVSFIAGFRFLPVQTFFFVLFCAIALSLHCKADSVCMSDTLVSLKVELLS